MYGNIAMYIKYCSVCLKIDYTLRCLEYICSVSSQRRHGPPNHEYTGTCILTITCYECAVSMPVNILNYMLISKHRHHVSTHVVFDSICMSLAKHLCEVCQHGTLCNA